MKFWDVENEQTLKLQFEMESSDWLLECGGRSLLEDFCWRLAPWALACLIFSIAISTGDSSFQMATTRAFVF